jgi:predicted metal-binding membrane protein
MEIAPQSPAPGRRPDFVEQLVRSERLVVTTGLLLVALIAWTYLLVGAGMDLGGMDMSMPMAWTAAYATLVFFMWWIMMLAMMLPSAAPMILLFALVNRSNAAAGAPFVSTALFALGYLLAWGMFSLFATGMHWALDQTGLLSPQMSSQSQRMGGLLLLLAGIYQFTPWKRACLRFCRGPLEFVTRYWRPGAGGALQMGLRHGAVCVGCCWVMMGLLFYGGVMNLYWISGIALLVLLEKLLPPGFHTAGVTGVLFVIWGSALLM